MSLLVSENWWLLVIALVLGVAVAWWIFVGGRRTRVQIDRRDTLDEGADRARRNQALIDASPGSAPIPAGAGEPIPPPTPEGLAGVGAAIQAEVPRAPAPHDDLTRIKGVGPKLAALLHSLGVTGFDDIARWDDAAIDRIDARLGQFSGRIRRDDWVEQARLLAAGDTSAFEQRFGKL
jgi:predicted flap endonuclease-1-like 5' DNA nuclease